MHPQDHYHDFVQCLADKPLPLDVTLVSNCATVELLEWLSEKKLLKAMKGGKALWSNDNLEMDRHRSGSSPAQDSRSSLALIVGQLRHFNPDSMSHCRGIPKNGCL